ncbi:hypothetical protein [Shimia sediminis]|uniref:hypothetical protein n=1 Tax=Shimia sediminis TaxID=2497945 RepID=UPI000F8E4253|nr:hypothetical protein [Shimia sediminis]
MGQNGQTYHKAIDRMEALLNIARALSADTPYQLVKASGIPPSTAYRQTAAMEDSRMLARDMQGRFMLGPECLALCFSAWGFPDPGFIMGPLLRFARIQTRQTAFVGFLRQNTLQLGPYSIGRGKRFAHPAAAGRYALQTRFKGQTAGRYMARAADSASVPVLLCPVVQNNKAFLTLGVFRQSSPVAEQDKITDVLRDAAQRLRTSVNFQKEHEAR